MLLALCAVAVVAAVVWMGLTLSRELVRLRADVGRNRTLALLTLFAPGISSAADNARALLAWQPLASAARALFPEESASLDRASGTRFPFSSGQIEAAHARWTSEWLAWESSHDSDFKVKAAAAEREMLLPGSGHVEKARLDAIEREKLELYQRRYEEYVRVSKALQTLQRSSAAS